MKVAKNLVFKIEIEIEIIEIHAILKLKLKYSKQSKFKSNWPHISVIEIAIEFEIHFKIEITLTAALIYLSQVKQTKLLQDATKVYGNTEFRLDGMRILDIWFGYHDSVSDPSDGFPHTSNYFPLRMHTVIIKLGFGDDPANARRLLLSAEKLSKYWQLS
jgi:hypothetical protein